MKLSDCKVIKKAVETGPGYPEIFAGYCAGYAQNGKPLEQCKKCPLRATFDPPKENCE